ncbi:MAG: hypothetical protein JNK76_00275, partial [Planctomycetales bacterium]|nr:hypothetical protein [Planctomycetales bacterium]
MDRIALLESRLSRLETQNLFLRRMTSAIVIAVVAAGAAGMAAGDKKTEERKPAEQKVADEKKDSVPDVVRAKRFEVVSADGHVVWYAEPGMHGGLTAVVSNDKQQVWQVTTNAAGNGSMVLGNKAGKAAWQAIADEDGGGTVHFDAKEEPAIVTTVNDRGGLIAVLNQNNKIACRITNGADKSDGGRMEVFNPTERSVASIAAQQSGGLLVLDAANKSAGFVAQATIDGGRFGLSDGRGEPAVVGYADKFGGNVEVFNPMAKSVVMLGANVDGGLISLANKNDKEVVRLATNHDSEGGSVSVRSKDGYYIAQLRSDSDHGSLLLRNAIDKQAVFIEGTYQGGKLTLSHSDGEAVLLQAQANGFGGLLELGNTNNKAVVRIGTDELSHGTVNVHDNAGLEVGKFFSHNGKGGHLYLKDGYGQYYLQLWNDGG